MEPPEGSFSFPPLPQLFGQSRDERRALLRFLSELEQLWMLDPGLIADRRRQSWLLECRAQLWHLAKNADGAAVDGRAVPARSSRGTGARYTPAPFDDATPAAQPRAPRFTTDVPARPGGTARASAGFDPQYAPGPDLFTWGGLAGRPLPVCRLLQPIAQKDLADQERRLETQRTCLFLPYDHAVGILRTLSPGGHLPEAARLTDQADQADQLDRYTATSFHGDLREQLQRVRALGPTPLARALLLLLDSALLLYRGAATVPDLTWYEPLIHANSGVLLRADDSRDKLMERLLLRIGDLLTRYDTHDPSLALDLFKTEEVLRSVVPGGFVGGEEPDDQRTWWQVDSWWTRRLEAHASALEDVLPGHTLIVPVVWSSRVSGSDRQISLSESVKPVGVRGSGAAAGRVLAVLRLGFTTAGSAPGGVAFGEVGLPSRVLYGG
jgi:hypothetical protein